MPYYPETSSKHPVQRQSRLALALARTLRPGSILTLREWQRILTLTVGVSSTCGVRDHTGTAENLGFIEKIPRVGVRFTGETQLAEEFLARGA